MPSAGALISVMWPRDWIAPSEAPFVTASPAAQSRAALKIPTEVACTRCGSDAVGAVRAGTAAAAPAVADDTSRTTSTATSPEETSIVPATDPAASRRTASSRARASATVGSLTPA